MTSVKNTSLPAAAFAGMMATVTTTVMMVSTMFWGCASTATTPEVAETADAWRPAMPAVADQIEPLGFMAGTWVMEQRGGAVIEEHWMAPSGNGMLGSFRRILGNGAIPFYEFTQIVAAEEEVRLRQIHVHGTFDTDPRRKDPMVLRLEKVEGTTASFVPLEDAAASNAGSLARVTYALDGDTLTVRVEERPRPVAEGETPREAQVIELPMRRVGT
jgi:hypothetical protein